MNGTKTVIIRKRSESSKGVNFNNLLRENFLYKILAPKKFKPKTQLLYLFLQNFVQKMRALNVDEIDTRKLEFHLTYE
jgi:hypothetical protein